MWCAELHVWTCRASITVYIYIWSWFILSTTAIPGSQYILVSVSPILSPKNRKSLCLPRFWGLGSLWSLRFGARRMAGEAEQWPNTAAEAASTDSPRRGEGWRDLTPLKWWCSIWLFKQAGGTSFGKHLKEVWQQAGGVSDVMKLDSRFHLLTSFYDGFLVALGCEHLFLCNLTALGCHFAVRFICGRSILRWQWRRGCFGWWSSHTRRTWPFGTGGAGGYIGGCEG